MSSRCGHQLYVGYRGTVYCEQSHGIPQCCDKTSILIKYNLIFRTFVVFEEWKNIKERLATILVTDNFLK